MTSKVRKKVYEELMDVASKECHILGDASINIGTIDEDLILLAYRYAPIKELKKLIVRGKQIIEEEEKDNGDV
jgi:hypothetical protein|tara:strand:- start:10 stop:228 length:219 start_codon:yes stop_codon:yes gene_type:complete